MRSSLGVNFLGSCVWFEQSRAEIVDVDYEQSLITGYENRGKKRKNDSCSFAVWVAVGTKEKPASAQTLVFITLASPLRLRLRPC